MCVLCVPTAGACGCTELARVQDRGKFRFLGVGTLEVISFTSDLFQSGRKVSVALLGSIGERARCSPHYCTEAARVRSSKVQGR